MKCTIIGCADDAKVFPRNNRTGTIKEGYGYCIMHWHGSLAISWKGYHGVYAED